MDVKGFFKAIASIGVVSLAWVVYPSISPPSPQLNSVSNSLANKTSVAVPLTFPLTVLGNQLVTSKGKPVQLIGADRSGTEYACSEGWGFFDGPNSVASVTAMTTWHINSVRLPLNEDCWLGINGVKPIYAGKNYQNQVESFVAKLNAQGIVAILDLHWNAPGDKLATGQQDMADASHSITFWTSVASSFKTTPGVIFDLYNEPNNISWQCWQKGCITQQGWRAVGMQQMVTAVRAVGASQPILLDGKNSASNLSEWLKYEPTDPLHKLIAGIHVYNFGGCYNLKCWFPVLAPLATRVPVITGELGQDTCASGFVTRYMNFADKYGISYLAWTWDNWGCKNGGIISNYDGTPSASGLGIKQHYLQLYARDRSATPNS